MLTLCMDTSNKFLVLALIKDDKVIASVQEECWKKQSEEIFPKLIEMFDQAGVKNNEVEQVVITEGPGSYTGVRIAMTIAKVFCAMGNVPLATISSLLLMAGKKSNTRVVLDARGGRAYTGLFHEGKLIGEQSAMSISDIVLGDEELVGDCSLFGKDDVTPDLASNFLSLKDEWNFVENVHTVVPNYLKSSESYMVKK